MAGQVASVLCVSGDNDIYTAPAKGDQRITIRISALSFETTEVKVFHVRQGRTKQDSDLVASYEDISTSTQEIKDLWIQNTDKIIVNVSRNNAVVVNVNEHRTTE